MSNRLKFQNMLPTHNVSDPSIYKESYSKIQNNLSHSSFGTPTRNIRKANVAPKTPDCFKSVDVETIQPLSKGKISKLSVAVRIRPMTIRELNTVGCSNIVHVKDNDLIVQIYTGIDPTNEVSHCFHYDDILWSCDPENEMFASQEKVYESVGRPLLDETFKGYNACLFAYGQTGSGKSYSMMGDETMNSTDAGIIPRFCKDLFDRIHNLDTAVLTIDIEVSYFEIYNEKIHDLLNNNSGRSAPLKVREHPTWGPYVVDLKVHQVDSYTSLQNWVEIGNRQRTTASTAMNDKSSRSHSIFSIMLNITAPKDHPEIVSKRSKISFVDLAGSERVGNITNNDERLRQGVYINRSLLALGKVIAALSDRRSTNHVPYRESVLTWLLRESLGGNSRTSMLATITPASCHLEETLSTLRYASQARNIVNRVRINEDPNDRLIRELRAEVEVLRALQQEYLRQTSFNRSSLNSSCISTHSVAEDENMELEKDSSESPPVVSECIIENIHGRLYVLVNDLKQNETVLDDQIDLKHGDKLVITGGNTINIDKGDISSDSDSDSIVSDSSSFNHIDDLNKSIAVIEKYCEDKENNDNDASYNNSILESSCSGTNFLKQVENILSVTNSPINKSLQIKTLFNNSFHKKSSRKKDNESIFKYVIQLEECSQSISRFTNNDQELNAIQMLNKAIQNVGNTFNCRRKLKSVTFFCDGN